MSQFSYLLMIDLLRENSLLLLFMVTAIGYAVGQIRLFNIQLGVAAVLFVGLFFGALDPSLEIPLFVAQLGLVIYLYTIGLSSGALFFRTFEQQGKGYVRFVLFSLTFHAALAVGAYFLFHLTAPHIAGTFAGSMTNTASLASILDTIGNDTELVAMAVVGYSLSYPIGVIGRIIILSTLPRLFKVDFEQEAHDLRNIYPTDQEIVNRVFEVTNEEMTTRPLRELQREMKWDVLFGRFQRDGITSLLSGDTWLQLGDVVIVAGEAAAADQVTNDIGRPVEDTLLRDQSQYVKRRLFVSNHNVAGQQIAALDLKDQYGALITRVRRGDSDVLANGKTVLELGDRVRVLARRNDMPELVKLFGDSYVDVSRVNLLSFGFGITLGLLLGAIKIPIADGVTFQLGFAGGPLIVALILGALRRTGSFVWTLPYSANQTLQQIGLILLLAGIGVRSGNTLVSTVFDSTWWHIVAAASLIVLVGNIINLIIGYKIAKIPFSLLGGMEASQPAVLNYLSEKTGNELPYIGYAIALPIGIILKVAYAQILLLLFG